MYFYVGPFEMGKEGGGDDDTTVVSRIGDRDWVGEGSDAGTSR